MWNGIDVIWLGAHPLPPRFLCCSLTPAVYRLYRCPHCPRPLLFVPGVSWQTIRFGADSNDLWSQAKWPRLTLLRTVSRTELTPRGTFDNFRLARRANRIISFVFIGRKEAGDDSRQRLPGEEIERQHDLIVARYGSRFHYLPLLYLQRLLCHPCAHHARKRFLFVETFRCGNIVRNSVMCNLDEQLTLLGRFG